MSVSYSIWPVVLSIYNLPPWLYNKSEYNIMSLIIPGPSSPGYDIDVYLQPLIEELKELWEVGVDTYDVVKDETFSLRAALLWTISDFPAYAMLSGWSTKGKFSCPNCNHKTWSKYLKYSKKMCYMGHRSSLKENHPWRRNKRAFDGNVETRPPPTRLSGCDVLEDLEGFENKFGKTQKKGRKNFPWKKKSIFFELPYWETNTLRHNLDVMHIEKNICDSVLGTLLDIPGKTKDHVAARFDLQDMGIRNELHPKRTNNRGKRLYSKACFSLSSNEKDLFCSVIKGAKFPDGCASNISRCVQSNERKVTGYKSHDAHFMLHYLLQVAVKNTLPKQVASTLIRLGSFFRGLCRKVLKPKDLDDLKSEIIEILCLLEKIFPPSFFDIMVHLPLHLVDEVRLGGPVQGRWMYPKERYLGKLKSYVKNRSQPEGSIAEAYLAEECLVFCSRYLHDDFSSKLNRAPRNDDDTASNEDESLFPNVGRPLGVKKKSKGKKVSLDEDTLMKAHRYVLFNCDEISDYISEHQDLVNRQRSQGTRSKRSRWARAQEHSHDIGAWFKDRVREENISKEIKALSQGPDYTMRSFKGYLINGNKFHTTAHESKRKTQCSGVSVTSSMSSFASSRDQNPVVGDVKYYGVVEDIIELDYFGHFKVVLFRCKWFQVEQDEFGLTCANFKSFCYTNDPFVIANQVNQVFYVQDSKEKHLHYVMETIPGDFFDMSEESDGDVGVSYWNESTSDGAHPGATIDDDYDVSWLREDLLATTVDVPEYMLDMQAEPEIDDSDDEIEDDTLWDFMQASEDEA
ncbi:uncharacterized protein LOC110723717 [Chenopodium quinoa]|uniref:uncharacterized protein LOC110723717 n=1 Tax=Chenopodium quinoa TaxID=63459 RepID=UPI000B7735AA|nr:uncharacterized protein LOC110723717 [Chenopodium quinoa]XP_021758768.1 uncharacterized protein LOC110723717 [Chenopodium quinoa]XP_021758769.1 uncharacterized protein LOC110723717 [Chenopodium quinoa]XP_021758770.1 uncharacterized protein LOC110723717 [Chenopodium quinoa]XP_021758771.1 uncharacterized protein LOC110723717 [Chenopodium quinoa]XP_021758772.1 uncharacterized protein LOC110723717 [Chenopodium quinoa]XP_021758773.1 uncharacterized protein LOC110723717 [Chenopodium quinoa]